MTAFLMPINKHETAEDFLSFYSGEVLKRLERMRAIIKEEVPNAEEVISYNIPAYKLNGGWLAYISGYEKHVSIAFPPVEGFYDLFPELKEYKPSKSTIQFPLSKPLPEELIRKMIRVREKICLEGKAKYGKK